VKPVNLYPNALPASGASSGPSLGVIGGAAAGVLLTVLVASFFALAHVDTIKSETSKLTNDASVAQSETQTVEAQTEAIGSPVVDSDKELATSAEKTLVGVYRNRVDFKLVANELQAVMAGTGGWYTSVDADSTGATATDGSDGASVVLEGYMPTLELAASIDERIESTRSFSDATTVGVQTKKLQRIHGHKVGTYVKFTVHATLVDTLAPFKDGGGASTGDNLVASGGGDPVLSLDSKPVVRKATRSSSQAAAAAAAAAKNPLALAASAALGGTK
jgi:hypothetical protein